jgi:hypothetical protein
MADGIEAVVEIGIIIAIAAISLWVYNFSITDVLIAIAMMLFALLLFTYLFDPSFRAGIASL